MGGGLDTVAEASFGLREYCLLGRTATFEKDQFLCFECACCGGGVVAVLLVALSLSTRTYGIHAYMHTHIPARLHCTSAHRHRPERRQPPNPNPKPSPLFFLRSSPRLPRPRHLLVRLMLTK